MLALFIHNEITGDNELLDGRGTWRVITTNITSPSNPLAQLAITSRHTLNLL